MTDHAPSARDLLIDAFGRIAELVEPAADDSRTVLDYRPAPEANTAAWLVWHLTRVQDTHVADLAGIEPVWTARGWLERFDLPLAPEATGYGADASEVAALDGATGALLVGYHADVHAATRAYLATVDADELGRVVDRDWDPPVTASARLVSVIGDCLQHLGQVAYLRGLAGRA